MLTCHLTRFALRMYDRGIENGREIAVQDQIRFSLSARRQITGIFKSGNRRHLSVVLPGPGYGCDKPLLAGATDLIRMRGGDIVTLNFGYNTDRWFLALPDDEALAVLMADGRAIMAHCLTLSHYRTLTVIGKSLGTISMAGLLRAELPENTGLIWLTPSLTGTGLPDYMAKFDRPAFSLIGSRDPSVALTREAGYRAITKLTHLEFDGMDHGWEHENGENATKAGLTQAISAMSDWLSNVGCLHGKKGQKNV